MIWKRWNRRSGLLGSLMISGVLIASAGDCAFAQITPDKTLPKNSRVTSDGSGLPIDRIDQGTIRGANLFHSFREFNVGEGRGAYFSNPSGIENILSRVTGSDPSDILGTLGVLGNANLFLMNPNGIIFGPNASLDVGGSFVGTTANGIQLGGTGLFSASEPATSNLLTVNPSALFFNAVNRQAEIVNRSTATSTVLGNSPINVPPAIYGLQVLDSRSLLLIGSDVSLEGSILLAPGGRVELGGLAESGSVGLTVDSSDLRLSFPNDSERANIFLTNEAFVDVTAGGGGSITINARRIDISDESILLAGIDERLGTVFSKAGDINLNATDSIAIDNSFIASIANSSIPEADEEPAAEGIGNSGDINIRTGSLSLTDGAELLARTFGQGSAGNITIEARDRISFAGTNSDGFPSAAFSDVGPGGVGNGGDITVQASSILLSEGAQLSAATFGQGDAGNVTIQGADTIAFDGVGSNGSPSGVFSTVGFIREFGGNGRGGNITVESSSVFLTNGAQISASTFGDGNAGNLEIVAFDTSFDGVGANGFPSGAFSSVEAGGRGSGGKLNLTAGSLSLTNGAQVSTSTFGEGDAGNLSANVADSVELIGTSPDGQFASGLLAAVFQEAEGSGGDLNLETGQLLVRDGAQVSTNGLGSGDGGNLKIQADFLTLNNRAFLSATTASGRGGDIKLQGQDFRLRHNSDISATAEGGGGSGGNITIDTDTLVALEDSDITANAFTGPGGRIQIKVQGLFRSQDSDIIASSALEINTPDTELQGSLTQLSANFISPEQIVSGSCLARRNVERGSFTVTGTGGLPRSPYEAIRGQFNVTGVQPIQGSGPAAKRVKVVESSTWKRGDPIHEAQGMIVTADGRTIVGTNSQLVALAKAQELVCQPNKASDS